jgi:hypothetical protein
LKACGARMEKLGEPTPDTPNPTETGPTAFFTPPPTHKHTQVFLITFPKTLLPLISKLQPSTVSLHSPMLSVRQARHPHGVPSPAKFPTRHPIGPRYPLTRHASGITTHRRCVRAQASPLAPFFSWLAMVLQPGLGPPKPTDESADTPPPTSWVRCLSGMVLLSTYQ